MAAPELAPWVLFVICAVALAGGLTQGTFGFGYPAISTPILVLVTDVKTAIIANLLPNLAVNMISIIRGGNWGANMLPHWPVAVYVLIGSFLGANFLLIAPGEPLRLMLGLMIFVFLYQDRLAKLDWSWLTRRKPLAQALFGLGAGFFSGTVNLSLPVLLIYFMLLGIAPIAMSQIMNLCFFGGRVVQAATVGAAGALPLNLLVVTLFPAVLAITGLLVGFRLNRLFDTRSYNVWLKRILFVMAVVLIVQGGRWFLAGFPDGTPH